MMIWIEILCKIDYDDYILIIDKMTSIIAIDYSGSTSSCAGYWNRVSEIYTELKIKEPIIILWDTNAKRVNEKDLYEHINKLKGCGGTDPSDMANLLTNYPDIEELHLITDGQIDQNAVIKTDNIMKNIKPPQKVNVDFVSTGGNVNLSVSAAFIRSTQYSIKLNGTIINKGDSSKSIDFNKYESYQEFFDDYEELYTTIVAQNLGKENLEVRKELLNLQQKLLSSYSAYISNKSNISILGLLNEGDYNKALIECKRVVDNYLDGDDVPSKIQSYINNLIKGCTSKNNYDFNIIKTSRFERAINVEQKTPKQIENIDVSDQTFECPIMMENDVPAILIKKPDAPLLSLFNSDIVDDVTNCPLNVWKYDELISKIVEHIDCVVGCSTLQHGISISPFTRSNLCGALTLGTDESHFKASTYSICKLMTDGKLLGNPDLWLAIFYYVISKKIPRLSETLPQYEKLLLFTLNKHKTNISLSGLPEYPMIKVETSVALWYVLASSDLFADSNTFKQCRLREYLSIAEVIIDLVSLLKLPYNKEYIDYRIKVLRAYYYMMWNKNDKNFIADILRAQYQNHIVINDKIIFLDGEVSEEEKFPLHDKLKSLKLEELFAIYNLVDPSKKIGDIKIPKTLTYSNKLLPVKNYGYGDHLVSSDFLGGTSICVNTMRPFYIDKHKNKEWFLCAEEKYGPLNKILSAYNYYIRFVQDNNSFPNKEEFLIYMYEKQRNKEFNPMNTLPKYVTTTADDVLLSYQEAFNTYKILYHTDITVNKFLELVNLSMNAKRRLEMELIIYLS